jgi:hypothetical protein
LPGCGGGISFLFTQVAMTRIDEFEQEQSMIRERNAEMKIFNFGIKAK